MSDTTVAGGLVRLVCYPVEVLGPGRRVGIWFQGCSRGCAGCVSQHSWAFDPAFFVPITQIERRLAGYAAMTDRLTISGGEPFEQPELLRLILEVAQRLDYRDILCYTGFTLAEVQARPHGLPTAITALVDGPFRVDLPGDQTWCGSTNQRLHVLTTDPVLTGRYADWCRGTAAPRAVQIVAEGGETFLIGIPARCGFPDA